MTNRAQPNWSVSSIRRVTAFEADVNADPCAVADRLWVKDYLDPEEEKLRFSK